MPLSAAAYYVGRPMLEMCTSMRSWHCQRKIVASGAQNIRWQLGKSSDYRPMEKRVDEGS